MYLDGFGDEGEDGVDEVVISNVSDVADSDSDSVSDRID